MILKDIQYSMNMEKRLRIVILLLIFLYLIILGTAFYYQIIGDQNISYYKHQKNSFEWKLIDIVKEDLKKIYAITILVSLILCLLVAGKAILKPRSDMISHFTTKFIEKFTKKDDFLKNK